MKVVVIGDVSWGGKYHLGDEAMTEVALAELRRRGAEVTLIAGDPDVSRDFYDVDTVPRFGYATVPRSKHRSHLDTTLERASGDSDALGQVRDTVAAVRSADAVVIAGGGNLNAQGSHHLYDRLTLKRLAEMFGIPLYVSSQTVGPHLLPHHRDMVKEIAEYARVFGARERATTALMREITGEDNRIVHTYDDAVLLEPAGALERLHGELLLPERYIVGSFTFHSGTTGLSKGAYYRELAEILDGLVQRWDADVLLLPHMGALGREGEPGEDSDVSGHERIAGYSNSGRVRSLPMIAARDALALTSGAEFTVSTRYHPVVFGAGAGVPAIGLVTSYYSAVRMRGALANVGLESFALPFETWMPLFGNRVLDALEAQSERLASHIEQVSSQQRIQQCRWWDGIIDDIEGTGTVLTEDLKAPILFEWADEQGRELVALARNTQEATDLHRVSNSLEARENNARLTRAERQLKSARRELAATRKQMRELQAQLSQLQQRKRPSGTALRDRLRRALRGG